jgi:pantothenate kinase-related protein Tda10
MHDNNCLNDYMKIFETVDTVVRFSSDDYKIYDWKTSCLKTLKAPANLHFKFAPVKRIIMIKSKHQITI